MKGERRELTGDDSASETIATIETYTVATSRTVYFNLSCIRLETLRGVLGGDSALNSEAPSGDAILGESQLLKRRASGNLDLRCDNVDACNLLGNGVLNLDTGVDLDEVVAVLLIDEELSRTSVAVVNRLSQLDGVGQDRITHFYRKVLCRGNFDNLLVSALDRAVALVQMDHVSMVVTKELHLDVLRLVQESLDENGAVSECALRLGSCTLESLLERLLVADDSHTTATTAIRGLNDDGESILVCELLDLLEPFYRALGTGHNGHISSGGELSGRNLVAKGIDDLRGGSDKL